MIILYITNKKENLVITNTKLNFVNLVLAKCVLLS